MVNKIECECGYCKSTIYRTKSQIKNSKSGNSFCGSKCLGEFKKHKIFKKCIICEKEFKVKKSTMDSQIACSIKCQGEWQSKYRIGENSSNYRGGGGYKPCVECGLDFYSDNPDKFKKSKFCSKKCKNENWIKNILTSEEFKTNRFIGNLEYRKNLEGRETLPEKKVRLYLESLGLIKDVDFYQEKGFFRKYFVDFYIPKIRTVIEVNGDYWHANPSIYGEGLKPLYESQLIQIEKDKQRKIDFNKSGFSFFEFWESDIHENLEKLMQKVNL